MNAIRSFSLIGRTVARVIEIRMRLFAAEFQLERMRFIRCLVFSILGAALLGTGFLAATALIVFAVDEENRITALVIITVSLFCAAAVFIGISLHYVFGGQTPFKATADALKEDGKCLISQIKN